MFSEEDEPQWVNCPGIVLLPKGQKCKRWQHTRIQFLCSSYQDLGKRSQVIYLSLSLLWPDLFLMIGKQKKNLLRN